MKKFLVILLMMMCFIPFVNAKDKEADKKVKVYVFEAGGCPYCELQTEYLKGLKSYNKKFVIVSKELFVDHVDWKEGKDYELGVAVAEEFTNAGFTNAAATGTPFVIISDLYAVSGYSDKLEEIIDKAYEEGDRDAVACIKDGKDDCVRLNEEAIKEQEEKEKANEVHGGLAILILGGVAVIGVLIYSFMNKNHKVLDEEDSFDDEEEVKEEIKEETKKAAPKKATKSETKASTTKKTTKKSPAKKTTKKTTTKKSSK